MITLLLSFALFHSNPAAAAGLARFDVRCDLGGHPAGADRLDGADEERLARAALEDAYPLLPRELRKLSTRIVFSLAHKESKWTKLTFGWGPEDDAEYRYPDTALYPQGTIKVSLSEKTLQALALGEELSRSDEKAGLGARVFSRYIIAHELIHAAQYSRAPLPHELSLHRSGEAPACRAGLLDASLLAQAEKRLDYERRAYGGHRRLIDAGALEAFVDAVEARQKERPEEFSPGGKYGLLSPAAASPFTGKLREEIAMTRSGGFGEFGPLSKLPNEGQVVPARIVWELKRLNDRLLESSRPVAAAAAAEAAVDGLKTGWDFFMTGENRARVGKFLPCDAADLQARYEAELSRYELLLAVGRTAGGR